MIEPGASPGKADSPVTGAMPRMNDLEMIKLETILEEERRLFWNHENIDRIEEVDIILVDQQLRRGHELSRDGVGNAAEAAFQSELNKLQLALERLPSKSPQFSGDTLTRRAEQDFSGSPALGQSKSDRQTVSDLVDLIVIE